MQEEFIKSSYYRKLRLEMISGQRMVNHALDNYRVSMSKELEEALQELYKAYDIVRKQMDREKLKNE